MLRYFGLFADSTRTGATFVHDATALAVIVVTLGHISFAWADPEARVGLRTGSVSAVWANHEHPLWAAELARQGAAGKPSSPEPPEL
jgi:formate dehydrogenase subunit gamma